MERKIMEYAQRALDEIRKAEKLFDELNNNDDTYAWKYSILLKAQKLFTETLDRLDDLETFFSDGDKLLPQEELEELVAEAMLEGEG